MTKRGIDSPAEAHEVTGLSPVNESRRPSFCVQSVLWRTARGGLLTVAAGALLFTGCASKDLSGSVASQEAPNPAGDLQVVDCRLPAQVRQIGHQFIYHRQTIKTSASDCEVRGGSQQGPSPTSKVDD